jgi:drug/metabolite transporter (DMT)-like permease
VVAFSGTLPATVIALRGFDPLLVGAGRTVIAAIVAGATMLALRRPLPSHRFLPRLLLVAAGCGIGFGVLSAIALRQVSASHAAVVVGLLPVTTAVVAVVRGGERPSALFWASGIAGAAVVIAFALSEGAGAVQAADVLLLLALVLAAIGYAEGGRLAREMPGRDVAAWGLILAVPVAVPLVLLALHSAVPRVTLAPTAGLLYVSVISMFAGFIPWYRGLAIAGVARASQVQLLQPFLTVGWAMLLLDERPGPATLGAAVLVVVCMACSARARFLTTPASHMSVPVITPDGGVA